MQSTRWQPPIEQAVIKRIPAVLATCACAGYLAYPFQKAIMMALPILFLCIHASDEE